MPYVKEYELCLTAKITEQNLRSGVSGDVDHSVHRVGYVKTRSLHTYEKMFIK